MAPMSAATEQRAPGVPDRLPETMRASVLLAENTVEVQERPVPEVPPGEVLVRVGSVGVCGSDVHYFRHLRAGEFVVDGAPGARARDGRHRRRRRRGRRREPRRRAGRRRPAAPLPPLLPVPGRALQPVPAHALLRDARRSTAPSPSTSPRPRSSRFPVARLDVRRRRGAPGAAVSVGIAAMRKARVVPGQRVLVAGAGPIGIIAAQVAQAFGAARSIVTDLVRPPPRARAAVRGHRVRGRPARTDVESDLGRSTRSSTPPVRPGRSRRDPRGPRRRHRRAGRAGQPRDDACR